MNIRDGILRDIDDTLAAIAETKKLLAERPSRSQKFALAGFEVQLTRLREELNDFDHEAGGVPEMPATNQPVTS